MKNKEMKAFFQVFFKHLLRRWCRGSSDLAMAKKANLYNRTMKRGYLGSPVIYLILPGIYNGLLSMGIFNKQILTLEVLITAVVDILFIFIFFVCVFFRENKA